MGLESPLLQALLGMTAGVTGSQQTRPPLVYGNPQRPRELPERPAYGLPYEVPRVPSADPDDPSRTTR